MLTIARYHINKPLPNLSRAGSSLWGFLSSSSIVTELSILLSTTTNQRCGAMVSPPWRILIYEKRIPPDKKKWDENNGKENDPKPKKNKAIDPKVIRFIGVI